MVLQGGDGDDLRGGVGCWLGVLHGAPGDLVLQGRNGDDLQGSEARGGVVLLAKG